MNDPRLLQAVRLLRRRGVEAVASSAGHDGGILALRVRSPDLSRLRGCAQELKALGFMYVTMDLDMEMEEQGDS